MGSLLFGARVAAGTVRAAGASTRIAEFLTAFALHGAAALVPLDPVIAFGALFKFGSLHKINKFLIVFVKAVIDPVFGAGHPYMVYAPALQAVMFFAGRTSVVV